MHKSKSELSLKLGNLSRRARGVNPFLGFELHNAAPVRPFFIVGSGRSGNTLLRRILNSNSQIFIPGETNVLPKLYDVFRQNQHLRWKDLVHLMIAQFAFHPEFVTEGIADLSPLVRRLVSVTRNERTLETVIDQYFHFAAEQKNEVFVFWGDKTPINTFYLPYLHAIFPEAKYVHMLRNGVDSVASFVKAELHERHTDAARQWLRAVELVEDFQRNNPSKVFEVRYEDLVVEPESITRSLCGFLSVEYEQGMEHSQEKTASLGDVQLRAHHRDVTKAINPESIGRGFREIEPDQIDAIMTIIGSKLEQLGYGAPGKNQTDV